MADGLRPLTGRHAATQNMLRWLKPNPRLTGKQAFVARTVEACADVIAAHCDDGPELVAGLRKLLEAKDCFVRQSIADEDTP